MGKHPSVWSAPRERLSPAVCADLVCNPSDADGACVLSVRICVSLAESCLSVCDSSETAHRKAAEAATESESEEDAGKVGWFRSTEKLHSARLHLAERGTRWSSHT